MSAQQRSHHLRRAKEIGPPRQFDLHALVAKELGLRTAPKRRYWMAIALSMIVGGITVVAQVPTGTDQGYVVAVKSTVNERQELSDQIREYKHIQIAEVAMSDFAKTKSLAADWTNASPISIGLMFSGDPPSPPVKNTGKSDDLVVASLSAHPFPATRTALSPEARLELQFWRPVAHSRDAERYKAYLRRYPSGAFADIATARIKEIRESVRDASLRRGERGTAKKKPNSSTSVTAKPRTSAKVAALTPSAQQSRPAEVLGLKLPSVASTTTKPSVPVKSAVVAISAQNTTGRCRGAITARCRKPLAASNKECIRAESNTMPSKLCFIHNYQSTTKLARQP